MRVEYFVFMKTKRNVYFLFSPLKVNAVTSLSLLMSIFSIFLRISAPIFQETFMTYQTLKICRKIYLFGIPRYVPPPLKCLKNSPRK